MISLNPWPLICFRHLIQMSPRFVTLVFLVLFLVEVLGRYLFYAVYSRLGL